MKFQSLYKLLEAKGSKPGDRYYRTRTSDIAAPLPSRSPIGASNYNPELPEKQKRSLPTPTDKGFRDERHALSTLKNTVRLLKVTPTFFNGLRDILKDFNQDIAKNGISSRQEMILTKYPVLMDRYWSKMDEKQQLLYRKRVDPYAVPTSEEELLNGTDEFKFVPTKSKDAKGKIKMKKVQVEPGINQLKALYEKLKERYELVQSEVEDILGESEASEEYYREKVTSFIRKSAQAVKEEMLDIYGDELRKASEEGTITPITIHSFDDLEKALEDKKKAEEENPLQDILDKIAVLDNLINVQEGESNVIEGFLDQYANSYMDAKDYFFSNNTKGSKELNQIITRVKEQLPLSKLKDFLNRIRDEQPVRLPKVTAVKRAKQSTGLSSLLSTIEPGELLNRKEEIVNAINELDIDENRKNAAIGILNNPRETPQKIIAKLRGMLGGITRDVYKGPTGGELTLKDLNLETTFDSYVSSILVEKAGARCTKVTGQTASTRSDKKYMRCSKVDGKLKRVHYGDPNLRIKKSNPKKRKSFRARHKCSTAKPGTPKYYSCKNW
jgi:hypothetical protein